LFILNLSVTRNAQVSARGNILFLPKTNVYLHKEF